MRIVCITLVSLACGIALAQRAPAPPAVNPTLPHTLTTPITAQGVPPTPAPAFPGLPSVPVSPSTPSTIGPNRQSLSFSRGAEVNAPNQVAVVQQDLAGLGLYTGPIDGQLDAATRAAVREFQLTRRLPATGGLDADTAAAISGSFAVRATTTTTSGNTPMSTAARIGPATSLPPASPRVIEDFALSTGTLNPPPIFIQP